MTLTARFRTPGIQKRIMLYVTDDGRGFDPARVLASQTPTGAVGLLGMQERVRLLNGHIAFQSRPGRGTQVTAEIPLEATQRIRERLPDVRVLILTVHDREDYLFHALRAGAAGYVLKGADVQDLLSAIRSVHQGGIYLYPTVTRALLADYLRCLEKGEEQATYDGLTERGGSRNRCVNVQAATSSASCVTALALNPSTKRTPW